VQQGTPCQPSSGWTAGEVTVYWFDVEQGDAQLIIGPSGRMLLVEEWILPKPWQQPDPE